VSLTPRRVLMTADAVGGVFSYALELGRALSEQGSELMLVLMGPSASADQRAEAEAIPGLRLVELGRKLEWMDDPWSEVDAAGQELLALERSYRPQLVHLNGYAHAALPFAAPVLVVAHSCVLSWWEAVLREPAPPRCDSYRQRVRAGLQQASEVVAPSQAMLAALQRLYGPLGRTRVLYNGAEPAALPEADKRPQVVAAGRVWDQAKNLAALGRIAPQLAWPVLIAGDTLAHEATYASRHAQRLGRLPRPELAQLLHESALFAAPARYEPFGLSILEAAGSGCALVLGDIPSLRELWSGAACFVPPDDDDALAAALADLIEDAPRRRRLAAAARARATCFSRRRFCEQYLSLYRSLASRSRAHWAELPVVAPGSRELPMEH
jgi:glycogen(starch) synthase